MVKFVNINYKLLCKFNVKKNVIRFYLENSVILIKRIFFFYVNYRINNVKEIYVLNL